MLKLGCFALQFSSLLVCLSSLTQLAVEVPPLASVPFPPPLDEGMTEDVWREHVMTPPQSLQLTEQKDVRISSLIN